MLVFPQLSSGALAQYPISRQLSQRSVQSVMEDGTAISLADKGANYLRWRVAFVDLSDEEANSLSSFFAAAQGNLQPFLFLDPTSNLLLWSQDFSQGVWQTPGLTFDTAVTDPTGQAGATRAHNNTAASLTITQATQIPGLAQICLSAYLRTDAPVTATLSRTAGSYSQCALAAVTTAWQRFHLSGSFPGSNESSSFALTLPPGAALELYGTQVEAQVIPSQYIMTGGSGGGVYLNARFDINQLDITATGPNRNACVMFVRCNLPPGE